MSTFESGVFAAGAFANSVSQNPANRSEVPPVGLDRPRGEAALVGHVGGEAFDRAGQGDHALV